MVKGENCDATTLATQQTKSNCCIFCVFICLWAITLIFAQVRTASACGQAKTNVAAATALSSRGSDGDDHGLDSIRNTRRPAASHPPVKSAPELLALDVPCASSRQALGMDSGTCPTLRPTTYTHETDGTFVRSRLL